MRTHRVFALAAVLASFTAGAAEKEHKLALGVFLPTSMADGKERFDFAEKLAVALGTALGKPVAGRSFGRYEDFTKAANDGTIDVAVIEAWAAAESTLKFEPVAQAQMSGETYQRWAIISRSKGAVRELRGKRLAVTRGSGSLDSKFVSNVIFAGDLDAQKQFKVVSVPSVESALKMVEVKSAESALVPASLAPKDGQVAYRSSRVPGAVALSLHGDANAMREAFKTLESPAPVDKFVDISDHEISDLRKLMTAGPPKRQPFAAESPSVKLDPGLVVNGREVGITFPSFLDTMDVPNEQPDD